MFKKKLFHKKISKILISITKRIESFFNIFKNKNFIKNIYFGQNKKSLDKKIFISLATILLTILVYFLLPSFYDKKKIKSQIENQILKHTQGYKDHGKIEIRIEIKNKIK